MTVSWCAPWPNECYLAGARRRGAQLLRPAPQAGADRVSAATIRSATPPPGRTSRPGRRRPRQWAIISLSGGTDPVDPGRPRPGSAGKRQPAGQHGVAEGGQRAAGELDGRAQPVAGLGGGRASRHGAGCGAGAALVGGRARLPAGRGGSGRRRGSSAWAPWSRRPTASTTTGFDALHFQGPGTDLEVGLLPSSRFVSGGVRDGGRHPAPAKRALRGGVHDARPDAGQR